MSESGSLQTLTRQKEGTSHGPCLNLLHECMGRVGGEDLQPEWHLNTFHLDCRLVCRKGEFLGYNWSMESVHRSGAPYTTIGPSGLVVNMVVPSCGLASIFKAPLVDFMDFTGGSDSKESTCNSRDLGSIPGRSLGRRNVYPLQYSCLESSTDRGAWRATWGCKESHTTEWLTHMNTGDFKGQPELRA